MIASLTPLAPGICTGRLPEQKVMRNKSNLKVKGLSSEGIYIVSLDWVCYRCHLSKIVDGIVLSDSHLPHQL